MELYGHDFLEELMALRRETTTSTTREEENQLVFPNEGSWSSLDSFDQNTLAYNLQNSCSSLGQELFVPQSYNNDYDNIAFDEIYGSLLEDEPSPTQQIMDSYCNNNNTLESPPFFPPEDGYPLFSMMEEEEFHGLLQNLELHSGNNTGTCKVEPTTRTQSPSPVEEMTLTLRKSNKAKKIMGQPSKNLMAERRRRKRLNDRLSMLRAIVPKISKMDRTAILGDTIDYMKELLDKINHLQQEIKSDSATVAAGIFKDEKPNEMLIRNSPKFEVERGVDTRVEVCCAGKPGLLLSTVNTLEALGLEIQQCVISCFNDFTMQASCSEDLEQRAMLSSEDMKQALFRSAGYGGRCM